MELKLGKEKAELQEKLGSNCTFMELKYTSIIKLRYSAIVLIVPLWN